MSLEDSNKPSAHKPSTVQGNASRSADDSAGDSAGDSADVIVVGGGLAGLSASITAARNGASVLLLERGAQLGGRSRSREHEGFIWNDGPRALYPSALASLQSLGVSAAGRSPSLKAWGVRGDTIELTTSLRNTLLSAKQKLELAKVLGQTATAKIDKTIGISFRDWVRNHANSDATRQMIEMIARTTTYAVDFDVIDASVVLQQLRSARPGVRYADGGWQHLVDSLAQIASAAGVRIISSVGVQGIERVERVDAAFEIHATDRVFSARAVVLAGLRPKICVDMVPASTELVQWSLAQRAVQAACFDLALRSIPIEDRRITLGIDRPLYLSFHTPYAKLAQNGGEVAHALLYLRRDEEGNSSETQRAELEAFVDRAQPGWRDSLFDSRYLHRMTVSNGFPGVGQSLRDRQSVVVHDTPGLFLAGDTIGPVGLLADAGLASGIVAGERAAHSFSRRQR
jgi:phytoene dehydrogenase-like protein